MTISKDVNLGNSFEKLTAKEKVITVAEQIVRGNIELMKLLNSMTPEDYNYYLPKVQQMIRETGKLFSQKEDDIPSELYRSPTI